MGCKLRDNFIFWAFAIWSQMRYSFLRYMCESSATPWADHLFHKTALNEASDIVDHTIKMKISYDCSLTMMVTIIHCSSSLFFSLLRCSSLLLFFFIVLRCSSLFFAFWKGAPEGCFCTTKMTFWIPKRQKYETRDFCDFSSRPADFF